MHCTALHCTVLYFTVLYCTVWYCTALWLATLCCTTSSCTVPHHAVAGTALLSEGHESTWTFSYLVSISLTVRSCDVLYCTISCQCALCSIQASPAHRGGTRTWMSLAAQCIGRAQGRGCPQQPSACAGRRDVDAPNNPVLAEGPRTWMSSHPICAGGTASFRECQGTIAQCITV